MIDGLKRSEGQFDLFKVRLVIKMASDQGSWIVISGYELIRRMIMVKDGSEKLINHSATIVSDQSHGIKNQR